MTSIDSYHGCYTPDAYKQGERTYRFLKNNLQEWGQVVIGFMWPDQELGRWVPVKGWVEGVHRRHEVPFALLPYIEYDEIRMSKLWWQPSLAEPIEPTREGLERLLSTAFLNMQSVEMQAELGLIADGMCINKPIEISLSSFVLHACDLNQPIGSA